MRKGVCIVFVSESPIPLFPDQRADEAEQSDFLQTSHALEKDNRSVPGPSQSASNPLSLFGQKCVCKQDTPSSSLYQGCGLCGEVDTSGVRTENRFWVYILLKTCSTLTWLAGTNMKSGIRSCGKSTINSRWQGQKTLFVLTDAPKQNINLIKEDVLKSFLQHLVLGFVVRKSILEKIFKKTAALHNDYTGYLLL